MAQFLKFGIVGGLGIAHKTWLLFIAVAFLSFPENLIILPIAGIILFHNYELNRLWTFRVKRSLTNFIQYATANFSTLVIYLITFWLLNIFINYLIASILAVGLSGLINFALARKIFHGK